MGTKVWLTHSSVLVVVAILVFYSRKRANIALAQKMEELQLRKRTEHERDRSMEWFARIFRTSPSPMLAQSARTGAILDVNPAFERCYGYTSEQVLGRVDAFLWADPEQRASYLERLFARRRTDQERVTGLRADGSHFEALISSEMGDDPQDRLIITTVADITAQNEAIERLRFGLELDGRQLRHAQVSWQNEQQLRFVLREGRKRQIRRMCEQVGLKVVGLKRVRMGSVTLGKLPVGQWRFLRPDERF